MLLILTSTFVSAIPRIWSERIHISAAAHPFQAPPLWKMQILQSTLITHVLFPSESMSDTNFTTLAKKASIYMKWSGSAFRNEVNLSVIPSASTQYAAGKFFL